MLEERDAASSASDGSDRDCPLGTVIDPPMWHANGTAATASRAHFWFCRQRRSLVECGAECGEVAVERRVRACLEDEVAFGVEDESAYVGDDGAAGRQEHAEGQADLGVCALDQVDEDLSALDLPEGDPVGRE